MRLTCDFDLWALVIIMIWVWFGFWSVTPSIEIIYTCSLSWLREINGYNNWMNLINSLTCKSKRKMNFCAIKTSNSLQKMRRNHSRRMPRGSLWVGEWVHVIATIVILTEVCTVLQDLEAKQIFIGTDLSSSHSLELTILYCFREAQRLPSYVRSSI